MSSRCHALALAALLLASCRDANGRQDDVGVRPAKVVPTTTPQTTTDTPPPPTADKKPKDTKKGDRQDDEWTPAEFKVGMARWKDTGVYVDGQPIGFLLWGELPLALQPTWVKDKVSDRKRPGTNDPGWKWARQRFYKFTDYFRAMGIDPKTIKEVHVYGSRMSQTLIATTKDLTGPLADKFLFRFGGNTYGKAIAQSPGEFGNGKSSDKISAVMVYIKKKPPTLVRNEGLELDGVMQTGVPYYGDPIRGGIRVYLDDKLATIIKRQELDPKRAVAGGSDPVFKLYDVLAAQGVDTKQVVEAWVIRDDRRGEKFAGDQLPKLTFAASPQAKGGVLLGDQKVRANAIALHTKPVKPEQIPQPTPDDD